MDLVTLLGLLIGLASTALGIYLGGGDVASFLSLGSVLIVFGGTISAAMIAFPSDLLRTVFPQFKIAFKKPYSSPVDDIELIVNIANTARKEGLLALEESVESMDIPFLKKGVMLIIDGSPPELVRQIMETDIAFMEDRHQKARDVLDTMADLAPAFGMVGTLIGLIIMLKSLTNPANIGASMSLALVTTFYGVLLANLFFKPLSKKLGSRSESEVFQKQLLLEGMLSIQDGENPRMIREKLYSFISETHIAQCEMRFQAPQKPVGSQVADKTAQSIVYAGDFDNESEDSDG